MIRTSFYTLLAMLAFSGNSILCRMALGEQNIDAASFTVTRLLSGIGAFLIILPLCHYFQLRKSRQEKMIITTNGKNSLEVSLINHGNARGSWLAGMALFVYAILFSFSYINLDTGMGALILFGSVQLTLILSHVLQGKSIRKIEWLGLLLALSGFVYLVYPQLTQPAFSGFVMMAIAGVAWAIYTLKGQNSTSPIEDTAYNFIRTLPFIAVFAVLILTYIYLQDEPHPYFIVKANQLGMLYAVLSGVFASAMGYFIWYQAVASLTTIQASTVQLTVPVLAAFGGLIWLNEALTSRLIIASVLVLGGVLTVTLAKGKSTLSKC